MASRVEIYGHDTDWRWRVRADNGEVVASGEGYTRRADAERGFHDAARAMAHAAGLLDEPQERADV